MTTANYLLLFHTIGEKEDRPPVIKYQPYLSSYEAVRKIYLNSDLSLRSICTSALEYTFRLPADIRDLIARLYREDGDYFTNKYNSAGLYFRYKTYWHHCILVLARLYAAVQNVLTISGYNKIW